MYKYVHLRVHIVDFSVEKYLPKILIREHNIMGFNKE
jgi:hypothetical protein